jgi:HEAT repeat protein
LFTSYAHIDGDFAEVLIQQIDKAGFKTWIDSEQLRAGEDWRQAIDDAIRNSFAIIVVMTPDAKVSEYVTYEWACGWGAGVKVIPILLKSTKLHPRLEALQFLDFTNRNARPWEKLFQEIQNVNSKQAINEIKVPSDAPLAIKRAIQSLDSIIPSERGAALGSLGHMNHPIAREALVQALNHVYEEVQRIAACILAETYKDTRAKPMLLTMLADSDAFERNEAINAAIQIWDEEMIDSLAVCLSDKSVDRKGRTVCTLAAEALEQIGTREALDALEHWYGGYDKT